jgi:predicted metal-dependent peptidase
MINPDYELDYQKLERELDRVKTKVFLGKNASFFGPLMCTMNFMWSPDVGTACTNGITLQWNPYHFLEIPPEARLTVLVHELWHPALLHMLRRGERNPRIWNFACDIAINNMLDLEGYSFKGSFPAALGFPPDAKPWLDHSFGTKNAEEIYDELIQKAEQELEEMTEGFEEDLVEMLEGEGNPNIIINNVVAAVHQAKMSGAGSLPGEVETTLKRFLAPKLPWEQLLYMFFNELQTQDYTWSRPNRRHQDIYLPSLRDEPDGLEHLVYFLDVSGSVSDAEVIRFNSEVKYIKDAFTPRKLTLVQFDTRITSVKDFLDDEPFEELVVIGRGGTSLVPVRQWIIDNQPTAAVIFSDLQVEPMDPLPINIPIIWVAVNNHDAQVNMGKLIHIRE